MRSLRASVARGRDGASSNSVRSLLQQRLAKANNFQKALITSLLAWVALVQVLSQILALAQALVLVLVLVLALALTQALVQVLALVLALVQVLARV